MQSEFTQRSLIAISKRGYDFSVYDIWVVVPLEDPKPITGASNETPIVVTCPGHGRAENASINIVGILGNLAANGTFQAKNVTTNTFELFDEATGLIPVAGTGDYISGGVCMRAPTGIRTVHWANIKAHAEGVEIGMAGVEEHEERVLLFFRPYLLDAGIPVIEPTMYFLFNGDRWDLQNHQAIVVDTGPNMATDPTVYVVCRKAVELAHTATGDGADFGFQL